MVAKFLVMFYLFWHGQLGFMGAGFLLRITARFLKSLQAFCFKLNEGNFITIDLRDVSAFYWINYTLQDKYEEGGLLKAISKFSFENCSIWDCGANCGLFSYNLLKTIPMCDITFFEPNPKIFSIAKEANAIYKNAKGYQLALSDCSGFAKMTIPFGGSTTATIEANKTKRTGYSISIECLTGDNFIEKHGGPFPDIIKIDTEGHEASVIRGLKRIITTKKPIIFFEHISLTNSEILDIVPNDYDIYSVMNYDGALHRGFNRKLGHNSALIPKDYKIGNLNP